MSSAAAISTNKYETQKLYLILLPFSMYDNPYKQYSRKVKLKRTVASSVSSTTSTVTEFTIVSSYSNSHAATAATSTPPAPVLPPPPRINGGVKLRKKMNLPNNILDDLITAKLVKNLQM